MTGTPGSSPTPTPTQTITPTVTPSESPAPSPLPQYTVTANNSTGGSVVVIGPYSDGLPHSMAAGTYGLSATPLAGYEFTSWSYSGDAPASLGSASTSITITQNTSVTANFALVPSQTPTPTPTPDETPTPTPTPSETPTPTPSMPECKSYTVYPDDPGGTFWVTYKDCSGNNQNASSTTNTNFCAQLGSVVDRYGQIGYEAATTGATVILNGPC